MIDNEWISLIDDMLLSDEKFTIKTIKERLFEKYKRNFGSIVIDNMLNVLSMKYDRNRKIKFKLLNVRSSQ